MKNNDCFYEQLARLDEQYPGKEMLTLKQSSEVIGMSEQYITDDDEFPKRKCGRFWQVAKVNLAKWIVEH